MRTNLVTHLFALQALAACGTTVRPTDAGSEEDDARIVVPDAGTTDAFVPPDAGDGLCGDTRSSTTSWAPLPNACLPRCSRETREAFFACDDVPCRRAALEADTTPTVWVRAINGEYELGCAERVLATGYIAGCAPWQTYACQAEHCPEQFDAWTDCVNSGGVCNTLQTVLATCMTLPAARDCVRDRVDACFAE
jgi:hypothetical protein